LQIIAGTRSQLTKPQRPPNEAISDDPTVLDSFCFSVSMF
jgi:hypothetical protein